MMIWLLMAVGKYTLVVLYAVFYDTRGIVIYPVEIVEVQLSFYWFSLVFHYLNTYFHDIAGTRSELTDISPVLSCLFVAHMISAYIMRFGLNLHYIYSYFGSFLAIIVIPLPIISFLYRRYRKAQKNVQVPAIKVKNSALQNPVAEAFVQQYPSIRTFVYNHLRENQTARCLFLHRRRRDEKPDLYEDILLEIPVDLKSLQPLPGQERVTNYLFQTTHEASAVLEQPLDEAWHPLALEKPLDADTLEKMDYLIPRYPSLLDKPLPLVIRNFQVEEL